MDVIQLAYSSSFGAFPVFGCECSCTSLFVDIMSSFLLGQYLGVGLLGQRRQLLLVLEMMPCVP